MEPSVKEPLDKALPNQVVKVRATLSEVKRVQLVDFLRENIMVFVWSPRDRQRMDPDVAQRYLNISLEV